MELGESFVMFLWIPLQKHTKFYVKYTYNDFYAFFLLGQALISSLFLAHFLGHEIMLFASFGEMPI